MTLSSLLDDVWARRLTGKNVKAGILVVIVAKEARNVDKVAEAAKGEGGLDPCFCSAMVPSIWDRVPGKPTQPVDYRACEKAYGSKCCVQGDVGIVGHGCCHFLSLMFAIPELVLFHTVNLTASTGAFAGSTIFVSKAPEAYQRGR